MISDADTTIFRLYANAFVAIAACGSGVIDFVDLDPIGMTLWFLISILFAILCDDAHSGRAS